MIVNLVPIATDLTIGDDYRNDNKIEFKIKLQGNEPVWLRLQVPIGSKEVLRSPEDANDIEVHFKTENDILADRDKEGESDNARKWWLGDSITGVQVDGKEELSVSISKVLCQAEQGSSQIAIAWQTESGNDDVHLTISKKKPVQPKTTILYFVAEPTSLLSKGNVTLSWDVVGDQPAMLDTPAQDGKLVTSPTVEFLDRPYTYNLKVGTEKRQVTVNVLAKEHWHDIPLGDDKFPSVIFRPEKGDDALYTVFVSAAQAGNKAALYKSANGITNWEVVNDAVPKGMESSPGVRLGNRLWLIGGSAVDPKQRSSRICYYDLVDNRWHDATLTYPDSKLKIEKRMGHACVSIGADTIWVLGGLGEFDSLNDVWSLTLDGTERSKLHASRLYESCDRSRWSRRCMFSAVNFNQMIWVCGGVDLPNGNPLGDIWTVSNGGTTWKQRPLGGAKEYVVANAISTGADSCGHALFAIVQRRADVTKTRVFKLLKEGITESQDKWAEASSELHSLPEKWMLDPHSLTLVGFKNRLYLRCLHRNAMYGVQGSNERPGAPLFVYVN